MRDDEKVQTEMDMKDVEVLENIFTKYYPGEVAPEGFYHISDVYVCPLWLRDLRSTVHRRDHCRGLTF